MSRRRQRLDIESQGQESQTLEMDDLFLEELEHIRTCPILRYIHHEPRVMELPNDDVGDSFPLPGWKKVVLRCGNTGNSSLLSYYWHVESGRLQRNCPMKTIGSGATDESHIQVSKIAQSLRQDAVSLAENCKKDEAVSDDARNAIHAAALAQVAEALSKECLGSGESSNDAWSSVARVLFHEQKSIQSSQSLGQNTG